MKKIISLIVTVCFVISSFNNVLLASTNYENDNTSKSITESLLPENLGNITFSGIKDSKNVVINIQDLHANPQVQKNINAILNYLAANNNIKSIYLEGASGKVDISWLKNLDTKDKTEITDTLLNIGMLTGTEYFSINDTHNIPLYGLEDKTVHQDNINRLSLMINDNTFIKEKLLSIKKDLNMLNNKFVNSENKKFAKTINKYKSKEISTLEFYSVLIKYIDEISKGSTRYNNLVNLTKQDYPNILLLKELLLTENEIDKNNLYKEFKVILSKIKGTLSAAQYKDFLSVTDNATNISELTYFIKQFAIDNNLNLSQKYPNINLLIQCKTAARNINFTKILKEEELLTNNIKAALSYNSSEYEIIFLNDFYTYLEQALTNNLTANNYGYFIGSINEFKSLYPKYVVYNQLKDLNKYIEVSKQFYKTNNERNNIFIEKIKNDIKSNDKNIIVLVTGGYHTEGLKELLSKQNVSFITVTPQIIGLTNDFNLYNNIIVQESTQYSKSTMAFTIASQMQGTTFVKALIAAGLQNKVPFYQIKQIAKKVFKDKVIDEDDNSFTLAVDVEPVTITRQNGYAVLSSDIKADESLAKDLSVFARDIDSTDGKVSIKLLLNLLNILNHYQSFDNFALTKENDILKAIINTLVFMVEELNIQFSNGFEQEYIEEYVNNEIINNPSLQDKTLDGIDINTARFLPKVIQSVLYENDKSEKQIQRRIKQAKQKVIDDIETNFLEENYDGSLQISGLISIIIKEILSFAKDFDFKTFDSASKPYLLNFIDISKALTYLTVSAFSLDNENTKGISLNQGLIGISRHLQYGTLVESMGHEFAHEMLLLMKDFHPSGSTKNLAHETHSFIFSLLFAQIFNEMLQASFSEEQGYRDYGKFMIDLDEMFKNTVDRNITRNSQSLEEVPFIHIPSLNFIKILNRCFDKDGKIMSLENLTYLAQTVREVFADKSFEELSYATVFYIILMEFVKKVKPNLKEIIDKYHDDIVNFTKFFTMEELDGNYLLIESFAYILLNGNMQDIENFINDKLFEIYLLY